MLKKPNVFLLTLKEQRNKGLLQKVSVRDFPLNNFKNLTETIQFSHNSHKLFQLSYLELNILHLIFMANTHQYIFITLLSKNHHIKFRGGMGILFVFIINLLLILHVYSKVLFKYEAFFNSSSLRLHLRSQRES